jgi:hypothetical protein
MHMKTLVSRFILAAGAFAMVGLAMPTGSSKSVVHASELTALPCTLHTVEGKYGFNGQGFLAFGTPQEVEATETRVATADGAGILAGTVTFSINGDTLRTPFTGTYDVEPDCTISFGTQTRHQEGVILLNGREIDFIQTDPGSILTRVAKHMTVEP